MQIEDSFTVGQNQQSRLDQFQHNYCSLILECCIASSLVQKKKIIWYCTKNIDNSKHINSKKEWDLTEQKNDQHRTY